MKRRFRKDLLKVLKDHERDGEPYLGTPATEEQVAAAEKKLGLKFAPDFRNYLLKYGSISVGSIEFTELRNGYGCVGVVEETEIQREYNENMPKDAYVIENMGIDDVVVIQNTKGEVFTAAPGYLTTKEGSSIAQAYRPNGKFGRLTFDKLIRSTRQIVREMAEERKKSSKMLREYYEYIQTPNRDEDIDDSCAIRTGKTLEEIIPADTKVNEDHIETNKSIRKYEKKMGLRFTDEYKKYGKTYGDIEIRGLRIIGPCASVSVSSLSRIYEFLKKAKDWYAVTFCANEDRTLKHFDFWQNSKGEVFLLDERGCRYGEVNVWKVGYSLADMVVWNWLWKEELDPRVVPARWEKVKDKENIFEVTE